MSDQPISSTKTLIGALQILAADIQSQDGVANAAIAEAADRLETIAELNDIAYTIISEFKRVIIRQYPDFEELANRWMAQADKYKK